MSTRWAAADSVTLAKREILEDITRGVVPASVDSFSELHDYVDANCYGGLDDFTIPEPSDEFVIEVQDTLDAWLRAGRREPVEYTGKMIDLTPTWAGLLPALLELVRGPMSDARSTALTELFRMAHAADLHNEAVRRQQPPVLAEYPTSIGLPSGMTPDDAYIAGVADGEKAERLRLRAEAKTLIEDECAGKVAWLLADPVDA